MGILGLDLKIKFVPFAVKILPILFILCDCIHPLLSRSHSHSLFKLIRIGLSQHRFHLYHAILYTSTQRVIILINLLLIPVCVANISYRRNKHGIDSFLVDGEHVHEKLIIEVPNCTVSNRNMLRTNCFNVSLDYFVYVWLKFLNITQF